MKTKIFSIFIIVYLSACSSQSVNNSAVLDENSTAFLYQQKCSLCHALPHPKRHRANEWPVLVESMQRRMVERKFSVLSEAEYKAILDYLITNAR